MKKDSPQDLRETLERIHRSIEQLNRKLDLLLEETRTNPNPESGAEKALFDGFDVITLLSLPDHLRKTAMVLCHLREASAEDVSKETKRARAVESDYLNQLVTQGYLRKRRSGHKVFFYIKG